MKISQAMALTRAYIAAGEPTFLWGKPGVGKSEGVQQIATEDGFAMKDVRAILLDTVDLRGLPVPDGDFAKWLIPNFLPNEKLDGPKGLLFLDELNVAPPQVQAACFGLVLERRLGDYTLPAGWQIVAAGNKQSHGAAAQAMPTALGNRFAHIDVEPDPDDFCNWAAGAGIDPLVIGFIRYRPNLLHDMSGGNAEQPHKIARDLREFPTPRTWAKVSNILPHVPAKLRLPAVQGLVGRGPAAEFCGFCDTFANLMPPQQILADPESAPTYDRPDQLHAMSAALSRLVDRQTFGDGLRYMTRCDQPGFTASFVEEATKRDKTLITTSAYVTWASANSHNLT